MNSATGALEERKRLAARVGVPLDSLAAFCDRWGVEEVVPFGSVLLDDFGPDIDMLIRAKSERTLGLFDRVGMQRELVDHSPVRSAPFGIRG